MPKSPPIYGLDFLTTSDDGSTNPEQHRIVAIGLATAAGTEIYDGEEVELLSLIDRRLGLLPTGVVATWFGSVIGFPLLRSRAEALAVTLQLNMTGDRRRKNEGPRELGPPDHQSRPQLANWRGHNHLDLSRVHTERGGRRLNSLRPSSNRSRQISIPDADELAGKNPEQNAQLIRQMTERRWPQCRKLVDRLPAAANPVGDQQSARTIDSL